jgi:hypothetical protein
MREGETRRCSNGGKTMCTRAQGDQNKTEQKQLRVVQYQRLMGGYLNDESNVKKNE